jgi:hypothetical protein
MEVNDEEFGQVETRNEIKIVNKMPERPRKPLYMYKNKSKVKEFMQNEA